MRVLALAICGYVAALQPARNARRQSLAVRQAPRGVRERAVHFISLQRSRRHRRDAKLDDIRRDGVSVETRERNAIAVIL